MSENVKHICRMCRKKEGLNVWSCFSFSKCERFEWRLCVPCHIKFHTKFYEFDSGGEEECLKILRLKEWW